MSHVDKFKYICIHIYKFHGTDIQNWSFDYYNYVYGYVYRYSYLSKKVMNKLVAWMYFGSVAWHQNKYQCLYYYCYCYFLFLFLSISLSLGVGGTYMYVSLWFRYIGMHTVTYLNNWPPVRPRSQRPRPQVYYRVNVERRSKQRYRYTSRYTSNV